ncbi:MAG: VOC family protein [Dehalococcoidia bacterium]|nr:VOC family protein [Dehalococcoidia bacterium]
MPEPTEAPLTLGLLDVITLRVPDVAAALGFYRDTLGAIPIEEDAPAWARVRLGNVDLGLHQGEPGAGGPEPSFRVQDIAAVRAHLLHRGVPITLDLHDIPGGVMLAFADPAGNVLAVIQYGLTAAEAAARQPG